MAVVPKMLLVKINNTLMSEVWVLKLKRSHLSILKRLLVKFKNHRTIVSLQVPVQISLLSHQTLLFILILILLILLIIIPPLPVFFIDRSVILSAPVKINNSLV